MNNTRTVLFDLDDTLLVEWKSARDSFIKTISIIDIEIDKEEFVKTIREETRKLWYELPTIEYCRKVGISSWEALWADFDGENENLRLLAELAPEYRLYSWANALKQFGINDLTLAEELGESFKRIRNSKHVLYSDTVECLEQLKPRYKLGLITNGAPDLQWNKINGSKLKSYFRAIVISGEYGFAKPDERLFYEAIHLLGCNKENTLMVGDKLKTDIKGAKEAGIKSVWLNRDKNEHDDLTIKPDFEIYNLMQLEEIISQVYNE